MFRTYQIHALNPNDGTEEIRAYRASSLREALTLAERQDAGQQTRIYGIAPEDYQQARQEGITFNEADGLLLDTDGAQRGYRS